LPVLAGDDESLDHFGVDEVAAKVIQPAEPESVAVEIQSGLRRVVWNATQVAEGRHQDKGFVELLTGFCLICKDDWALTKSPQELGEDSKSEP
jgi:hypothetical protein